MFKTLGLKEKGIFKFLIDEPDEFTIEQTNKLGNTTTYVSMSTSKEDAIGRIIDEGNIVFKPNSKDFKTS